MATRIMRTGTEMHNPVTGLPLLFSIFNVFCETKYKFYTVIIFAYLFSKRSAINVVATAFLFFNSL